MGQPIGRGSISLSLCALLGSALLALNSCNSSTRTMTAPAPTTRCAVQVQSETASFPASGGSGSVRVVTNRECAWSARSDVDWLKLSTPADGQGEGSVSFAVAGNNDPSSRGAAIVVNDQRQQISQEGRPCEFRVSSNHEQVGAGGGDRTIQVTASGTPCNWTAAADVPWITIASGNSGSGNGEITFHVEAMGGSPRSGSLNVAGQIVRVDQGATGCSYAIGASALSVGQPGGPLQVAVSAAPGCGWTAQSQVSWITIESGGTGSGPGVVSFRVAAANGPTRTGSLIVAGQAVTVEQTQGCSFGVDPSTFGAPSSGGGGAIKVITSAGCQWSASSGAPWVTFTRGSSGTGPGLVEFMVAAHSGTPRQTTLTVAGLTVIIDQGTGCTYTIDPSTHNAPAAGGSAVINVGTSAAGCLWSASSAAAWVTITRGSSGSGPGQVEFSTAANTGPARQTTLTIASRTVTVQQSAGCSYTVQPTTFNVPASTSKGVISVGTNAGCSWAASSSAPWITINQLTDGGPGQVEFVAAANTGPARQGSLTIANQTVSVTQANGCTYSIAPSSQDVAPSGGSGAVSVTTGTGCPWTASGGAGWITFPVASSTGPGQAQVVTASNPGPPRTDTVTIAGLPFTVRQSSACSFVLSPGSALYDQNGGVGAILVIVSGPCTWTAASNAPWITITTGSSGAGDGLVQIFVAPATSARTGTINIAGQTFTLTQTPR
jgi:all-beta uncharacterized protein/BACON domain-containing protein